MSEYDLYHFSLTLQTTDAAILGCLRSLAHHTAGGPRPQISWGGTKEPEWKRNGGKVVLRFTSADRRTRFLAEANRVIVQGFWTKLSQRDDDPAERRR